MNIESVVSGATHATGQSLSKAADQVSEARKQKSGANQVDQSSTPQVQPEELLQQIKELTEGGLYSVRFENDAPSGNLIVKVVDRESDEVIRQIPPEELLELTKRLNELRGNIVNTEG